MPLFDAPIRPTKEDDLALVKKSKKKSAAPVKRGGGLLDKIERIRTTVTAKLGKYRDDHTVITDELALAEYLNACISNGVIAIDTETTGLDVLSDTLVGICIYTPGQKGAYIPVNHISYITREKLSNQIPIEILRREFQKLEGIEIIMFNADFDTRIFRHQLGVYITCTWDCYLAARLMNENEKENKLKPLHNKYVLCGKEDVFSFGDLFKGITFDLVPIDVAQLYAAHDGVVTYEFYEFQKQYLYYDSSETMDARNGMNGVAWVFFNIEMPLVNVVADMEDTGVAFDMDVNAQLKTKYHKLLDDYYAAFQESYKQYSQEIAEYKSKNPKVLDDPINIKSVPQLQALLFDIIGLVGPIDKKTKQPSRSTDKEALTSDELKDNEVVKAIMDYRAFSTLVDTFIDKLPECVRDDGRIHCKFNQYGADTGRFSSSEPNLQNIPSHNKDIRKMFKASDKEEFVCESEDNCFVVDRWCEVNTSSGWKYADKVEKTDQLVIDDNGVQHNYRIADIITSNDSITYYIKGGDADVKKVTNS